MTVRFVSDGVYTKGRRCGWSEDVDRRRLKFRDLKNKGSNIRQENVRLHFSSRCLVRRFAILYFSSPAFSAPAGSILNGHAAAMNHLFSGQMTTMLCQHWPNFLARCRHCWTKRLHTHTHARTHQSHHRQFALDKRSYVSLLCFRCVRGNAFERMNY